MYKLINFEGQLLNQVQRLSDGAYIPFDPANSDYIAYLEWCKSNTPLPADEGAA